MLMRKQGERILRFLIVLLALGTVFSDGNPLAFLAKGEPAPVMQAASSIRITDQADSTIDSLSLNVDLNDPLFPNSQAFTIRLRSTSAHNILIKEVHFFDKNDTELTSGNPDPTLRPGITLTPDPVGQTLPLIGTPVSIRVTPIGVFVRPGLTLFPISGGKIEFDGDDQSIITVPTKKSLGINIFVILAGFTVPTLSEWGRIIMFLLLSATGLSFLLLRHHRAVFSIGPAQSDIPGAHLGRVFELRTFSRVLAAISGLTIIGAGLAQRAFGGISAIDLAGSLTCGVIIAFVAHLFIITRRQARISAVNRRNHK